MLILRAPQQTRRRGSPSAALLVFGALVGGQAVAATSDYAVQVSATVQVSPPKITLNWPSRTGASYVVYSKAVGATSWGTAVATLAETDTSYEDTTVSVGVAYEYQVHRNPARGYVCSGIELPLVEDRGKVVLVVDNTFTSDLAVELERLEQDLVGDGWRVIRHDVPSFDVGDAGWKDAVVSVRDMIVADYNSDPSSTRAVLLFGHVPVPYSGMLAPDGHGDHIGAWPADVYYAEMDGTWTDSSANSTAASDVRNHNVPGDGKFDQSSLPSDVELEVGRVDLHDMPAFSTKTELDLLRQYLDKDHAFRHADIPALRAGLIDDNFGEFGGEAFAASGWRNYSAFFGASDVSAGDWVSPVTAQTYLAAYGCGGGWYQGASGVGSTADFASGDPKAVFTILFGSYHGDWDVTNSFLRAPLATTTCGLTCLWAGRPHWFMQHMAVGETIGYAARLTQNNSFTYRNSSNFSTRGVHVALMGDPTLRLHPVDPPSNLGSSLDDVSVEVTLNWSASTDTVEGYHIYRSTSEAGPFSRITSSLVAASGYTDTSPPLGPVTYMVRAVKLEQSASGTYYNPSQGVFATLTVTDAGQPPVAENQTLGALQDAPVDVTLTGTDANGDPLTFTVTAGPSNGSLTGTQPDLTYTPNGGYLGQDSFTFTANDGRFDSAEATVTIQVVLPGDDFDADGLTNAEEDALGTDMLYWDSDGDGFSDGDEVYIYETDPLDRYSRPVAHTSKPGCMAGGRPGAGSGPPAAALALMLALGAATKHHRTPGRGRRDQA